jgi:hypothetical protein
VDGERWCGQVDTSDILPRCGCEGRTGRREVTAVVFRLQTYSTLQILEMFCDVCGCGSFDGSERMLLRKATVNSQLWTRLHRLNVRPGQCVELCFHWDLMYAAFHSVGFGGFNVLASWKSCVDGYHRMGLDVVACSMLLGLYKHFLEGFMDTVDLMHLPFLDRMQCQCEAKCHNLVADGITISCQRHRLDVIAAIDPDPHPETDIIQFGSKHQERVVVRDKHVRDQLYALVHGGLTPQECNSLREKCENANLKLLLRETCSAVIVANGRTKCAPWARDLFHEVSSNTPACAIVQQQQIDILDAWMIEIRAACENRREAQLGQMRVSVRENLPVLYETLNKIMQLLSPLMQHAGAAVLDRQKEELGRALLGLLDDILKVMLLTLPVL